MHSRETGLESLEPRRLLAATVTYTLIELDFEPKDLNNADQILAADAIEQVRRGGRLTATSLPKVDSAATLVARRFNDDGIVIGSESFRGPNDESRSQEVLIGPDRTGQYQSRYLYDNTTSADDQPNAAVVINNPGQILTNGGEDATPDLTGDVRLITVGRRGALTSVNANGLLPGGTRTIDDPIDLNNAGQFVTTDAHFPVDNFVTLHRGVASLRTAQELAGGVAAPIQQLSALNDVGQIVGATQQAGAGQQLSATLYQTSRRGRYYRTFLGALPGDDTSEAVAINNAGQILGTSFSTPASGPILDLTATITQRGSNGKYGAPQDLNGLIPDPGKDRVTRPIAINDAGLIIAEGASTRNGTQRFVLLIPSRANRVSSASAAAVSAAPPQGVAVSVMFASRKRLVGLDDVLE
ncbi:MAG TPA: hypothetical protein VH475_27470 [Tepidisphaeraceae bacterium]